MLPYYVTIAIIHAVWHINKNRRFYIDPESINPERSRAYHLIFYTLRLGYIPVFWNELALSEIVITVVVTEILRLALVAVGTGYFMKKSLDE